MCIPDPVGSEPAIVDVCVIGLGVSSLPLLRALANSELSFLVLSQADFGVWGELARRGEDFDLLSSNTLTAYSWWDVDEDFHFMSAREYHARLQADVPEAVRARLLRLRAERYQRRADGLTDVYVRGQPSPRVRCRHLVVTVGQSVRADALLEMMDESLTLRDQTVLIEGYGDTTNMVMARLMLGGNRVVFSTAHFQNLDKVLPLPPDAPCPWGPYDVFEEYEHMEVNNHERSPRAAWHAGVAPYSPGGLSALFRRRAGLDALVRTEDFCWTDRPGTLRSYLGRRGVGAGWGYPVKYWPVDGYFHFYDGDFGERMRGHRMLLNDPYFFIKLGRVQVVHPSRVSRLGDGEYRIDGEIRQIDRCYRSEASFPRRIEVMEPDGTAWRYAYTDFLHGVWSAERPGVYFLGGERPTTGAFGGTAEIQCALVERLIRDPDFTERMIQEYPDLTARWRHDLLESGQGYPGLEHTQFTGVTNQAIARLLGAAPSLWTALRDGRLREFVAGPCVPARYPSLTHQAERYQRICDRWTNRFAWGAVARDVWAGLLALNGAALALSLGAWIPAALCLLMMAPIAQKAVKCLLHDALSYGDLRRLYPLLVGAALLCLALNLGLWAGGLDRALDGSGWLALRSGLPLVPLLAGATIARAWWGARLIFNDARGKEAYAQHFERYLQEMRQTPWFLNAQRHRRSAQRARCTEGAPVRTTADCSPLRQRNEPPAEAAEAPVAPRISRS